MSVKKLENSDLYVVAAVLTEAGFKVDVENSNKTHKTNILRVAVPKRKAPVVVKIKDGNLFSTGPVPGFTYTPVGIRWVRLHI